MSVPLHLIEHTDQCQQHLGERFWMPVKHLCQLVVFWIAAFLLIWPTGEWPINDDWAYTRVVEGLTAGRLAYTEWQGMPLFSQALWGVPFVELGSNTFFLLRCSMMVVGFLGGMYTYLILGLYGSTPSRSRLGAFVLLFNPLYLHLSLSFMTDVFTIAFSLAGFYHMERFRKRKGSATDPVIAILFIVVAALSRQTALLVPLGVLGSSCIGKADGKRSALIGLGVLIPAVLAVYLHDTYFLSHGGLPANYAFQLPLMVRSWLHPEYASVERVAYYTMNSVAFVGLSILPLTIHRFGRWSWKELAIGTVLFALGMVRMDLLGDHWPFTGDVWHAGGVGPLLFPGYSSANFNASLGTGIVLHMLASSSFAKLLAGIRIPDPAVLIALGAVLPLSIIYLSDRYMLFSLGFLIPTVVRSMDAMPSDRAWLYIPLALMGFYAVDEQVFYHDTRKKAHILASKIPEDEAIEGLNAGFEWNAYHRFQLEEFLPDHPEASWCGTNTQMLTPVGAIPGYTCVDSAQACDLIGTKRITLRMFVRDTVTVLGE